MYESGVERNWLEAVNPPICKLSPHLATHRACILACLILKQRRGEREIHPNCLTTSAIEPERDPKGKNLHHGELGVTANERMIRTRHYNHLTYSNSQ